MKTLVPHYYKQFKCKADLCRHTCCKGWEIDIDDAALSKYRHLNTRFGEKIISNINFDDGSNSFKLTAEEDCPFLNGDKLCDIILTLGEDYICDICRDHPRFRHFYSDRVEVGLGICCEEACRIVLSDNEPFSLVSIDGESESNSLEETEFLARRDSLLEKISSCQNVKEAVKSVNSLYGVSETVPGISETASFLMSLEILDPSWLNMVNLLNQKGKYTTDASSEAAFLNLYKYFIFRYLSNESFLEAVVFAELSVGIIRSVCERTGFSMENICDVARMYSAEIEYSDENIDKILEFAGL